jgi:hypothetical protein
MAQDKKSFVAYSDWHGMFKALPDEVAGKLIKHVFSYVNDENPTNDDYIINALFEQIKSTLKRDLKKWEKQREQRSEAGKKSAELRATKSNERSTSVNEKVRNSTVNDNVNVNVNVNDNVNDIKKRSSSKFSPPPQSEVILYFIESGYSKELGIKAFNYYDVADWKDGKGNQVKNWKQKMQSVWFKEDNKDNKTNNNIYLPSANKKRRQS